jgi:Rod binding domain-containing protein
MSLSSTTTITSDPSVGPLPPGVGAPKTTQQHALYDACKSFEAVFVQQIVSEMLTSARGDDPNADPANAYYQQMGDDQMTGALVNGGTFGLAGVLYGQLAPAVSTPPAASTTPSAATPPPNPRTA